MSCYCLVVCKSFGFRWNNKSVCSLHLVVKCFEEKVVYCKILAAEEDLVMSAFRPIAEKT